MSVLEAVGWALVHFVWQGALVAAVVALALAALRPAKAPLRYAVSAGALFTKAVLPAATAWRLVHAPSSSSVVDGFRAAILAPLADYESSPDAPRPAAAPPAREPSVTRWQGVEPSAGEHQAPAADRLAAAGSRIDRALPWLVGVWAFGVTLLSLRLLGGWLRARRLAAAGVALAPAACRAAVARLSIRLDLRRTVRVLESRLIEVPVAMGWLRPVVLLPASALSGLTVDQLEAILAHELAHIRRHDYLVNLAQSVIETVLFYHPAVWWVSRQVREERERCCDDLAVAACGDREGYARALVGMERLRSPLPLPVVRADGGSLVARVRRLLTPEMSHVEPTPRWAASAIALATALTVSAAAGMPAIVTSAPLEPGPAEVAPPAPAESTAAAQKPGATPAAPQASPTIVQGADPASALADRWAWAEQQARTRGWTRYWIGYAVQPPQAFHNFVYSDRFSPVVGGGSTFFGTLYGDFHDLRFPGVDITSHISGGDGRQVKLLFSMTADGARSATVTRTHFSTLNLPVDLANQPLLWVGQAGAAQSLPLVNRLFAGASTQTRHDLVTAIGLHDDSSIVVPQLVKILTGSEPDSVRGEAAERLAWHPGAPSLAALDRAARSDRAREVRREAAESIGELDLPEATPTLLSLAKTLDDREVRLEAVEALGERSEPAARDGLISIARTDRDEEVQQEAVETLGELKDGQGVAALKDLARTHASVNVRREAIEALGEAMPPEEAAAFLARVAREDANVDVQREAVETLGELKEGGGLAALRELARTHPNIDVRREAVETLGESMAPGEAVELLTRVVREDPDTEMQRTAVESLGPIDDPSARKALFELARTHPSVDVRREAVEALAEAPPSQEVVDLLARIVREDKSPDVQSEAVEALGEISDGRGLSEVAQFALTHPVRDVRHEAIETLAEHAPPATSLDVLKRIVADERDEDARQDALEALAELPDGAGIPALIDVARSHPNQEVRREALKRLVESDDPRARAVLDRALTKP